MKYKSAFVVKNALIRNSSHVKAKKNPGHFSLLPGGY